MQAEPLFHLSEAASEFAGFITSFLASGAIGFRYAALRGWHGERVTAVRGPAPDIAAPSTVFGDAAARAAMLGVVGTVVSLVLLALRLPEIATRQHKAVGALLTSDVQTGGRLALLVLALLGFALAAGRRNAGWPLAALGVLVAPLLGIVRGWTALVNPVHVLVAGLWIGTLLVLVAAGLPVVLRSEHRGQRGALAADMVNGFSPLALTCGGLLVLSGLVTAWRHLRGDLTNLWTTPYGLTLIGKLCVVAVVFALGAWNWRRQRPTLGSEEAAVAIRRSSLGELAAATVVLLITAVLVSIPAPRPPRAPGAAPTGAPPTATAPAPAR